MTEIIPAILTDSVDDLRSKFRIAEQFAPAVHIDMCDGVYVPTRTVTLPDVLSIPTTLRIEFHLMMHNPGSCLSDYLATPAERILLHADSEKDIRAVLVAFAKNKQRLGLALQEHDMQMQQWMERWKGIDELVSQITFVTVHPGKQHQALLFNVLEQAKLFHAHMPFLPVEIDGGVHRDTIQRVLSAHPERIILGSDLWQALDPEAEYREVVRRCENIS